MHKDLVFVCCYPGVLPQVTPAETEEWSVKIDSSVRWEHPWPLSDLLLFIFHWTPGPGAASMPQAQTSAFSMSWAGWCEGGLASENPACLAPQGMEKADVYLSAAEQSFFPTFFPLQHCPWALGWNPTSCPSWAGSQGVHIPLEEAHQHIPAGMETLKSPKANQAAPHSLQNSSSPVWRAPARCHWKAASARHIRTVHFYPHTGALSSLPIA